ncbi:MAG: MBL fold metallo-hydrolase [Paludibacter sp.]|jgi:glyoxylase-like metal-dependent hydrolase (beta-lactamase superfamily II)
MTIKTFTFNPFQENTYIVHDETNEAVIIDAGCLNKDEKSAIINYLEEKKLTLKRVINTHLHLDHQFGNKFIFDTFGIKPEANIEDEYLVESFVTQARSFGLSVSEEAQAIGNYIVENQEIKFGNTIMTTLLVPGHSPGSVAFYSEKEGVVFVGDVLFRGSIGRTDLPRGDFATLILSITKKLFLLPDSTVVYSGHGPTTTIGYEKKNNPYL